MPVPSYGTIELERLLNVDRKSNFQFQLYTLFLKILECYGWIQWNSYGFALGFGDQLGINLDPVPLGLEEGEELIAGGGHEELS